MNVLDIYDESYARRYEELYIAHPHWRAKHDLNVQLIRALLPSDGTWLDTCCGQGWHLSQFPNADRVGLDLSPAQLEVARRNNPGIEFVRADVLAHEFGPPRQFDLVTNFWGSYSYLDDEAAIVRLVEKLVRWTRPGGSFYMELITPSSLGEYNTSSFAATTASGTSPRSADFVRWGFSDPGGQHELTSPPLQVFLEILEPHFEGIDASTSITTMRQVVARGKKAG